MALQCISILSVLCLAQTAQHPIPRRRGAPEAYLAEMPKGSRLTKLARRDYKHLSLAVIKKGRRTKTRHHQDLPTAPRAASQRGHRVHLFHTDDLRRTTRRKRLADQEARAESLR
jgi:hypothetical protein